MRTLDILLNGRPEIIGKLSTFYHHMNFGIETTHAVGGTYNIILGNRRTENTRITEFLLHPFRYVKYSSFILIRYILPPESVRITSEFRFERLIDGSYHKRFFSFHLIVCTIGVFLRFVRLRQYKIENALRIRFGSSHCLAVGCN